MHSNEPCKLILFSVWFLAQQDPDKVTATWQSSRGFSVEATTTQMFLGNYDLLMIITYDLLFIIRITSFSVHMRTNMLMWWTNSDRSWRLPSYVSWYCWCSIFHFPVWTSRSNSKPISCVHNTTFVCMCSPSFEFSLLSFSLYLL